MGDSSGVALILLVQRSLVDKLSLELFLSVVTHLVGELDLSFHWSQYKNESYVHV